MANSSRSPSTYSTSDWTIALLLAVLVEASVIALLAVVGSGHSLTPEQENELKAMPIAVTPVIDLPLLKLGSKQQPKLPDMWRKRPPKKRYRDVTAPAANADQKQVDVREKKKLAKPDEKLPPEDAEEFAEQLEEEVVEEEDDPNLNEEGAEDGLEEGVEADPLKAFVISQYRLKLIAWFKAGFHADPECGTFTTTVNELSADRTFVGFSVIASSGNAAHDAAVRAHLQGKIGQKPPPPPPNYKEILSSTVQTKFTTDPKKCNGGARTKPRVPAPSEVEPDPPVSREPPKLPPPETEEPSPPPPDDPDEPPAPGRPDDSDRPAEPKPPANEPPLIPDEPEPPPAPPALPPLEEE